METKKITELDEVAAPAVSDIVPVVVDPAGTEVTKKAAIGSILGVALAAIRALTAAANKIPYFTSGSAAGLLTLDTDGALAANEDSTVATQKATKTYADTKTTLSAVKADTDVADAISKKHSNSSDHAAGSDNQDLSGLTVAPAANTDANIPQWNGANTKTLKDGLGVDIDGALAANSDSKVATQKATKTYADTKTTLSAVKADADVADAISKKHSNSLDHAAGSDNQDLSGLTVAPAANTDANIPQWNGVNSKTLKDGLGVVTSVGAPGADTNIPTEKAVRGAIAAAGGGDVTGPATNTDSNIPQWNVANSKTLKDGLGLDIDGALAANSDSKIATQKAVKTYADTMVAHALATAENDVLVGAPTPYGSWVKKTLAEFKTILMPSPGPIGETTPDTGKFTTGTITKQLWAAATELTIATGAVTATQALHTVDTQADAASDDLDTINGGADGQILAIRAAHTDRTVVAKHNTGNILTDGADISLDSTSKYLFFFYDGALSKWVLVSSGSGGITKSVDAILSGAPVILTLKGSDGNDYYIKGYPTKT